MLNQGFTTGVAHFIRARSSLILYQAALRSDEMDYKVHETLAFQE